MIGRVVSTKMNRTAVVLVESERKHPLYQKSYKRSKKYFADDKLGVKIGDIVEIVKIRPISKFKHWKVVKVLGRDIEEIVEEQLKEEAAEAIGEVLPERSDEIGESDDQKTREVGKKSKKGGKSRGSA